MEAAHRRCDANASRFSHHYFLVATRVFGRGGAPPHFGPNGLTVDSDDYRRTARTAFAPFTRPFYYGEPIESQQDGAAARNGASTLMAIGALCGRKNLTQKTPTSHDLSVLGFHFRGDMERHVHLIPPKSIEEINAPFCKAWPEIDVGGCGSRRPCYMECRSEEMFRSKRAYGWAQFLAIVFVSRGGVALFRLSSISIDCPPFRGILVREGLCDFKTRGRYLFLSTGVRVATLADR